MVTITPELIERKQRKYGKHRKRFTREGFTEEIALELIPVTQLRVWDMFRLFQLAKGIPDGGTYLEIGSKWGGSLRCVFRASEVAGHKVNLWAIEPIPNRKFKKLREEIEIHHLKARSEDVADQFTDDSIDLLFIDGPHNYTNVSRDLSRYWPKIKAGGTLAGHDHEVRFPGVIQAVREFFGEDYLVLDHSTIYTKERSRNG